jgi:hypothetical protein
MEAAIASDESALSKRYKASSRHTMQVDAADYLYHLEKAHRSAQQAV